MIEGMAELQRKLTALGNPRESQRLLRNSVAAGMRVVQKAAKAAVPVGTREHETYRGRLVAPGFASRSLRVLSYKTPEGAGAVLGVKAEAFYALQFIELGTAKITARPWLVPAFVANKDAAIQKIMDHMRERIARIAR